MPVYDFRLYGNVVPERDRQAELAQYARVGESERQPSNSPALPVAHPFRLYGIVAGIASSAIKAVAGFAGQIA